VEALIALGACYAPEYKAWAWPMSDGDGNIIGIRLRSDEGKKWAVTGSRQGIFLPKSYLQVTFCAFLPEGPTDTAALLSLGFYTIGRPTCSSGNEFIKAALKRLKIYNAVVVSDEDEIKNLPGGIQARPGIVGARRLKAELKLNSIILKPPGGYKDMRAFVRAGGSKALIESAMRNQIWSKK
jgi:hypothetical protein